jgi:enoyl-[acyl-carrier-protein] reductase (NADH)
MIATAAFESQARYEARQLGADDLRLIVIPHPFATLHEQEVAALAESIAGSISTALAG